MGDAIKLIHVYTSRSHYNCTARVVCWCIGTICNHTEMGRGAQRDRCITTNSYTHRTDIRGHMTASCDSVTVVKGVVK